MVLFIESKPQDIVETEMQSLSLNNGRNAGNADKMGISGVAFWRLALKWL